MRYRRCRSVIRLTDNQPSRYIFQTSRCLTKFRMIHLHTDNDHPRVFYFVSRINEKWVHSCNTDKISFVLKRKAFYSLDPFRRRFFDFFSVCSIGSGPPERADANTSRYSGDWPICFRTSACRAPCVWRSGGCQKNGEGRRGSSSPRPLTVLPDISGKQSKKSCGGVYGFAAVMTQALLSH